MCELIRDYICKHCAGDLYIEKKIDKTNQLKSSYKAIIYCKSCASHVEICSYSKKDFNNNIKDVLGLIGMKNKSNTFINKIPTFYNQYQYMNYQEAVDNTFIQEELKKVPSVQHEQKTGRWIYTNTIGGMRYYGCTICTNREKDCIADENEIQWYNYCPNCGAKMESDNNDS